MKKAILLAVLAYAPVSADVGIELLPSGRPFRLTFADPREIRMALGFEGDAHIHASVGNYFSLVSFAPVHGDAWRLHVGLEGAGYFTMRSEGSRFPLETTDGLIGFYVEGSRGPWQLQWRFTHISAHLSDGISGHQAIPYSREFMVLRGAWVPTGHVQLYGGVQYLTHTIPVLPRLTLQAGGSYFLALRENKLAPFAAVDLQWRGEAPVNPAFSLQLGFALNNPPEAYQSFRFFYGYFTGQDPRGQFLGRAYTAHSLGVEMQI